MGKMGKQPQCPSGNERLRKAWRVRPGEHHSAMKKEDTQPEGAMRTPDSVKSVSHSRTMIALSYFYEELKIVKLIETKGRLEFPGAGGGRMGVLERV